MKLVRREKGKVGGVTIGFWQVKDSKEGVWKRFVGCCGFAVLAAVDAYGQKNSSSPVATSTTSKSQLSDSSSLERSGNSGPIPGATASEASASSSFYISHLPTVTAQQAFLVDADSGAVLYEKNADMLMMPSSMTKVATACFVMSKIRAGEIDMETFFTVSKNAYRREGTTMFLKLGQKVSVGDLLEGLIVVSANDAAVVLAEGLCGSESAFAAELTAFVKSYGALATNFTNPSGLPDPRHQTTSRDLALIAHHAIHDYPEIYHLYGQTEFTFNGVTQSNKNILLKRNIGCDGLKTGHTEGGGFGIVATCLQDGQRLILVINGCTSESKRAEDAVALLSWGRRQFINHSLYKANDLVAQIPVWYGEESYLPITLERNLTITLPRSSPYDAKILLCYDTPTSAPVTKGAIVGEIRITSSTMKSPLVVPLIASVPVAEAGFFKKITDSFLYLVWGIKKPEILDVNQNTADHG